MFVLLSIQINSKKKSKKVKKVLCFIIRESNMFETFYLSNYVTYKKPRSFHSRTRFPTFPKISNFSYCRPKESKVQKKEKFLSKQIHNSKSESFFENSLLCIQRTKEENFYLFLFLEKSIEIKKDFAFFAFLRKQCNKIKLPLNMKTFYT